MRTLKLEIGIIQYPMANLRKSPVKNDATDTYYEFMMDQEFKTLVY